MGYFQKIDAWLDELLNSDIQDFEPVEREIKAKLLESYRNGQRDCPRCNPRKPEAGRKPRKSSQENQNGN